MDEVLLFLVKHLSFLYKDFGFKIVDSEHADYFGGVGSVILQSGDLKVMITNDRGFIAFYVRNPKFCKKSYDWFSPDILWQLVKGEVDDDFAANETTFSTFLKEHITAIVEYLTGEDAEENFKKMRLMKKARAKRLFG